MRFLQKLCFLRRRQEAEPRILQERRRSFSEYREAAPEVLRYMRREKGIAKRNLELIVIDNEEEPAWQVGHVVERLLPEVKLLTIVTGRQEYFSELAQDVFEEYGLLVVVTDARAGKPGGNLILDLRDWEEQFCAVL